MLGQPQLLPQISVKGYRELLKRLRQQSNEEASTSSALFQQAKEMALAQLQRKNGIEKLNPRRAFTKLRQRIVDATKDLKDLKDQKKGRLRATYAALRDQRLARKDSGEAVSVLGTDGLSRALVLGAVGFFSRGFMTLLNSTEVEGAQHLTEAMDRPPGKGLITVSNHTAALDDPLLLAALMPPETLLQPSAYRWGTCATDRCFKNGLMAAFFRAGKTLPVERGAGLEQPGIRAAGSRLNAGDWVHIFPEGTRSRDGRMGPIRKGVGHLIASCSSPPTVVPFVHSGMDQILPPGTSIPRTGQRIRVLIGEPLSFADLFQQAKDEQWDSGELSKAISLRLAKTLYDLKARLEGVPVAQILSNRGDFASSELTALLPLIEEQMDGLQHSWKRKSWNHRMRSDSGWLKSPWRPYAAPDISVKTSSLSLRQRLDSLQQSLNGSPSAVNMLQVFASRTALVNRWLAQC